MHINDYLEWTASLAMYPGRGTGNIEEKTYLTLGMVGETGELSDKVKKVLRDELFGETAVKHELGDILWYWTRLVGANGLKPEEVMGVWKPASYKVLAHTPIFNQAVHVLVLAGAVAQYTIFTELEMSSGHPTGGSPAYTLSRIYNCWRYACYSFGFMEMEVLLANVTKLEDRKSRRVLKGSGDNR